MSDRVSGTVYFKIDGQQLECSGGVEAPLSKVKRTTRMGPNGPVGYDEVAVEPYVKGTFYYTKDFPIEKVTTATDMAITVEWPNGKSYALSGAYHRGESVAKSEDGTAELDFGGKSGEWL